MFYADFVVYGCFRVVMWFPQVWVLVPVMDLVFTLFRCFGFVVVCV